MDQLKIVLEHKFWILAGLAIILPPIGWWAATSGLADDTTGRMAKIEASEKSLAGVKDVPNDKWIQGAKEIGKELTASVAESQQHLYEHQKPVMKFPPIVQNQLDHCHLKYRQDGSASTDPKVRTDFQAAKDFFVGLYDLDWKTALEIVKPYKIRTGEGLVLLPLLITSTGTDVPLITRHSEVETWRQTMGFTAGQMYDVEEDVWFLTALLRAIAKVNEGATEIGNARIKRVTEATLRGGDLSDLATRRTAKAGSSGAANAIPKNAGMAIGGRSGGGGGGGGASDWKGPKNFDPDDVFGADGSKEAGGAEGRSKKDLGGAVELRRWVENTQKYNKRGFVLKLVMDEREIPTLLTAFSESPFPIEIKHVEYHAYTNRSGADFSQIANAVNELATEGAEQPTKEQQQQQHRILEGLRMAFNVNYLADVTIAGTLTIYSEPAAAAAKSAAPAKSGTSQPVASGVQPKVGASTAKATPPAKSPATSASKMPPTAGIPAAKTAAPAARPAGTKTPTPAGKSATTGK